jgi:hypothetical protein
MPTGCFFHAIIQGEAAYEIVLALAFGLAVGDASSG